MAVSPLIALMEKQTEKCVSLGLKAVYLNEVAQEATLTNDDSLQVKTDGKLDIRFISYWSDGKEISGHCCDNGLRVWCNDKCDPIFTLCIDGPDGREKCSLYESTTVYIDNHNTIHFGSSIQGTANPFIINVPKAVPSSIKITVQVYDKDDFSSDDHMDTLSKLINIQAATSEQTALYTPYTVWGRTKLQIEVRAYCDPDWYGSVCETYCKAPPDQSDYTCNEHNGAKVCFEGWKGDVCDEDVDECAAIYINNLCQHGGSCTNTRGGFECSCVEGITGRRCENIINQCALKPCLNGGTCDGNQTDFHCACSVKWTGETCAETVNFCDSASCNRGNCTPELLTATGFKCDCDFAWVGERCSQSVGIVNITLLGEIDHTNRGDLTDGLNRLITELWEIPGKVDVKFTAKTQTECNYTTTYVQLYSAVENDTILDSALVNVIFESNSDDVLNEYLPLPLYPPRQEEKSTVKRPHGSWNTDFYVLAILPPLGFVLMTVLLVAMYIWRRRSHNSEPFIQDDEILLFQMGVPFNRNSNPHRRGTITRNLQDASVSPDGYTSLRFHDVHRGTLVTHCDDTSNIQGATGDMTLDPWSQEGASVPPDENARHDDAATLDTRRHVTSYIQPVTGDMTLDPCHLQGEEEDEYTVIDDNDVEDISQEDPHEMIESFDYTDVENISQEHPYER
ncbi:protein jagged-1-like [Haliotis rufescens]|uniref:protein jagged-1-like n=1 Tax=Haliotis rufescens TaxID=6454 RepID=UPI00201F6427|nr:protein jagged-1-like [Haliotis rufescens]